MVDPIYLRWVWDSVEIRSDIEDRARTAAGIYKINQGNLAAVKVPVPPLEGQREIVAALSEQATKVVAARRAIEAELAAIEAMPGAILRRAFSGEL